MDVCCIFGPRFGCWVYGIESATLSLQRHSVFKTTIQPWWLGGSFSAQRYGGPQIMLVKKLFKAEIILRGETRGLD